MKKEDVHTFFARLAAQNPNPVTELCFTNPYTLLVAVVLSAQATDKGVNNATKELFKKVKTPEQMVRLGEEGLKEHIKTINYFNAKARNVIRLSQQLIYEFQSQVPRDRDALQSLAGVGRKTANVVLNVVWGEPTMAVDTHVFRVSNRTGLAKGDTPEAVEKGLMKVVPTCWAQHTHHWLILQGRYVCKARKPLCGTCVVRDLCGFKEK